MNKLNKLIIQEGIKMTEKIDNDEDMFYRCSIAFKKGFINGLHKGAELAETLLVNKKHGSKRKTKRVSRKHIVR